MNRILKGVFCTLLLILTLAITKDAFSSILVRNHLSTSKIDPFNNLPEEHNYDTFGTNSASTILTVHPQNISVRPGDVFTVDMRIEDVANLRSLDIRFSWDPQIIRYLNHRVAIPVEDYPEGILHKTVWMVKNEVNETGIAGGWLEVGTRLWIAYSTFSPAPAFSGSGTVFHISFEAVNTGSCGLKILGSDLVSQEITPISHDRIDGHVESVSFEHDVGIMFESPLHAFPGTTVILESTVLNFGLHVEQDVGLVLLIDGELIDSYTLNLEVNSSFNAVHNWTPISEGFYNVTLYSPTVFGDTHLENNLRIVNILVSNVINVPLDCPTIQEAIDIACPSATIEVASGTYYEQLLVEKPLEIRGQIGTTVVDARGNDRGLHITTSGVTIDGLIIRNCHSAGVYTYSKLPTDIVDLTIQRSTIKDIHDTAIFLVGTSHSNVVFNTILNASIGLSFWDSNFNNLVGNDIRRSGIGIKLVSARNNTIYHNNIVDNHIQIESRAAFNLWQNGYGEGNYWSDYVGKDIDGDGVGDTLIPHQGVDSFPLIEPWTTIPGDLNVDCRLDIYDVVLMALIYGCAEGEPEWNPKADLAYPWGRIDILDLVTCAYHYGEVSARDLKLLT